MVHLAHIYAYLVYANALGKALLNDINHARVSSSVHMVIQIYTVF